MKSTASENASYLDENVQNNYCSYSVGDIVYNSGGVKVTVVSPNKNKVDAYYSLYESSDEEIYQTHYMAVSGKMTNVREVVVEYEDRKSNMTLFDFHISKVLFSQEEIKNNVLTIGSHFNSYNAGEDFPIYQDGKEFILFCRKSADSVSVPISGFVDYITNAPPMYEIEKIGSSYLIYRSFSDYSNMTFSVADGVAGKYTTQDGYDVEKAKKLLEARAERCVNPSIKVNLSMFFLIDSDIFEREIVKRGKMYLEDD